ncbi:MAG TPA: CHAT domain-containing protein, partial [Caldilineaceae bacterium]|nr:CHAT domain-containing protein [Caldilineaceae bacterium]
RTAFLDDKATLYSDLVSSLLAAPDTAALDEAFAVIERARARALLERLLATVAGQVADEADAALAAQRAEVQQRLHWLYNQLMSGAGGRHADNSLNEEIRGCERTLQQLEWRSASPLAEAQPLDLPALQATLAADQQAVVYYQVGSELIAFVVGPQDVQLFRRLCTVNALDEARAAWRFQLERAEMGAALFARHAERYQQAWRSALLRLYTLVWAPLAGALSAKRLLIIPYGSLHDLPFHALWDGRQLLLERFELSYAPSASIAVRAGQSPPVAAWRSLAALALTDPAIPAARLEVTEVAACFPQAQLYLDGEGDLAGLQRAAHTADVLHIATHGRFRPDNPYFSVLQLADGWVDVRSLYRLRLAARLVVLSACESGVGGVSGGDEVIGVARAFLAAGARSLVASLWNVHDASTATLMTDFYMALIDGAAGLGPAGALRLAQLRAARQGQHPFYWASFFAIGPW